MALTIATGFVVDDAIVVLENMSRHIEQGMTPFEAALHGAREVGFTVLSMSLSLIAVFIPILLMGGIVGRLFREFAVTLSAAILVSLVVSLTTTPMMCARCCAPRARARTAACSASASAASSDAAAATSARSAWALRHGPLVMLPAARDGGLNVYLYIDVPKGFFPQQDTGRLGGSSRRPGHLVPGDAREAREFVAIVRADPAVESVVGFTGGGAAQQRGSMFIALKPLAERKISADQVDRAAARQAGARAGREAVPVSRCRTSASAARQANAQYQYTLQADDLELLRAWEPRVPRRCRQLPELADVNTDQQDKGPADHAHRSTATRRRGSA